MKARAKRHYIARRITLLIRLLLIASILLGAGQIIALLFQHGLSSETLTRSGPYAENLFYAVLTLLITWPLDYLERRQSVILPQTLAAMVSFFLYASIFLGSGEGFYNKFWWWDDMVHALSGVILGLIGFLLVYLFNARYNMTINPLFVAIFTFTFALSLGVFWEFFEFGSDALFHMNMQRWADPPTTPMIGQPYQGSGLRDTMSDLMVDAAGAAVASVVAYYLYKAEKRRTLRLMRRTFPNAKKTPGGKT